MTYIKTKRLLFRDYNHSDVECLKEIMQERDTMQYFPSVYSNSEVEALVKEMSGSIRDRGFGLFSLEKKSTKEMIGIAGIRIKQYDEYLHLDEIEDLFPAVELFILLGKKHWNQGLATEAANAILKFVRKKTDIKEVYAFVSKKNLPALNVIDKIGMEKFYEYIDPYFIEGHRKAPSLIFKKEI